MTKRLGIPLVLGIALATVPTQTGCGGSSPTDSGCAKAGQSCMTKSCCPRSDGTFSRQVTFSYPGGVQTMSSCTCN
jgi:hypothetical protein